MRMVLLCSALLRRPSVHRAAPLERSDDMRVVLYFYSKYSSLRASGPARVNGRLAQPSENKKAGRKQQRKSHLPARAALLVSRYE